MTDWREYDHERKADTAPEADELVWVWEAGYQGEPGASFGYFDGHCFRMWWGTDDCHVTHWAEIEYPAGPS